MTRRFPIKEIARQSGLGTATVDRVLHGRPNVSPQTRNRVAAAIRELEAQETLLGAQGRRLFVDIVVEAPRRFTREIRIAAEAALAHVAGAVIRLRFHFQEVMEEADVVALLRRIRRRGSQAVCVKLRDTDAVCDAVDALVASGIPVFTLVTDLPVSRRSAYVGLDNENAGRTAAYLLAQSAMAPRGSVLALRSQEDFFGETLRFRGFRRELKALRPGTDIVRLSGGAGLPGGTARQVAEALERQERIAGVYSIGGGNAAILDALAAQGLRNLPFVAHDLDRENVALLRARAISFVLHHDLTDDMRSLYGAVMAAHGLAPWAPATFTSDVRIVAPHNIPDGPARAV